MSAVVPFIPLIAAGVGAAGSVGVAALGQGKPDKPDLPPIIVGNQRRSGAIGRQETAITSGLFQQEDNPTTKTALLGGG